MKRTMNADDIAARLAELDTVIARAAGEATSLRRDIDALGAAAPARDQRHDAINLDDARRLERRLEERSIEITQLTGMVRDLEQDAEQAAEQLDWLTQALTQLLVTPMPRPWWARLTGRGGRDTIGQRVDLGPLFDQTAYLRRYPDVIEAGMDPLLHYVMHGRAEGRAR